MHLNLVAPINQLGYGVVGYNVLKSLLANHDVSYFAIGKPSWDSDLTFVKGAIERAQSFNKDAPSIRIWHQNDLAMFPGGGQRIGWPIFELNKFTDIEKVHLSSVDKLFVCSNWAKTVLEENGIKPPLGIHVVPLGVDTSIFYKNEAALQHRAYWTQDKTVFLNVGKWEVRKGHNELVEAFNAAFTPEDDVELWMLNHNPFIGRENENWKTKYLSSPMGGAIKIIPRMNSQKELCDVFNSVDFGVFPAHAEGWNLEPLELMACGIPSIVTNYSGHTEYLNETNSLLVEPNGMESARDGRWFHGNGEWCTFEIDELVAAMRAAHDYKFSSSKKFEDGMAATVAKFSWSNTVKCIEEAL
jgi:glycosyltransferase involved in cell wall biosynthesis